MWLRPSRFSYCRCAFTQNGGAAVMVVEQEHLQDLVARALERADAEGDHLIAALLSQCLDLLEHRTVAQF
jgi:hypothetical protein